MNRLARLAPLAAVALAASALSGCSPAPSVRITSLDPITCTSDALNGGTYDCNGAVEFDRHNWDSRLNTMDTTVTGLPGEMSGLDFGNAGQTVDASASSAPIVGFLSTCTPATVQVHVSVSFRDNDPVDYAAGQANGTVDASADETVEIRCQ